MTLALSSGVEMDTITRDLITEHKLPLSMYDKTYLELGPANRSAIGRLAAIASEISRNDLPIPPSPLIEYIADKTSGTSKQDFSMVIDGRKGSGKSYSSAYIMCRYAIEMGRRFKKDPKDFFSLKNCALLEDTEAIARLIKEAGLYQGILIDDASTAVGSRNFMSENNKNFNMLLSICRPRRWFILFNTPVNTHIDLQIRELVDVTATVHQSFHSGGFNVLKVYSSDVNTTGERKRVYKQRFHFFKKKFKYWVAFSPDLLDPYKGFAEVYDKARDEATIKLINRIAEQERLAKNPILKRDSLRQEIFDKYGDTVKELIKQDRSTKFIMRATGLSEYRINVLRGKLITEGEE
jgi:hypothetical protein